MKSPSIIIVFSLVLSLPAFGAEKPNLSLEAKVITAIADGPVVVQLELTNHGSEELIILDENYRIDGPKDWTERLFLRGGLTVNEAEPYIRLRPRSRVIRYLNAKYCYEVIGLGHTEATVRWDIVSPSNSTDVKRVTFANLKRDIDIDVKKYSKQALIDLSKDLVNVLSGPGDLETALRFIWAHLDWSANEELLPVALALLDKTTDESERRHACRFIRELPLSPEQHRKIFYDYLCTPNPGSFVKVFYSLGFGQSTRTDVSGLVRDSKNMWVRMLAAAYDERLSERQAASFASDIKRYFEQDSQQKFDLLLAKLNSPSFKVREQANKDLVAMGECAEHHILVAVRDAPLEVEFRLRTALEMIKQGDALPLSLQAIETLKGFNTVVARKILAMLADGNPELRATIKAKEALVSIKDIKPEHPYTRIARIHSK